MLELPEARTIARQMSETLTGKTITNAAAGESPHGFAFYSGEPEAYAAMLNGQKITGAVAYGGRPELHAGDFVLSFSDGVNVRYYASIENIPKKRQLMLALDDGSAIACTVQMYGGLWAFPEGSNDEFYYVVGKEKPSPLSDEFNREYFSLLLDGCALKKTSAKAFLATEQRIPGLGNGVLQDILWQAKIHPKRKMNTLSDTELEAMYLSVKKLLAEMAEKAGRDTENDLFGTPGGYLTVMSRKNNGAPCPVCGEIIERQAYLGGNVYVCAGCQKL